MIADWEFLGTMSDCEREEMAIESLAVSIQMAIQKVMAENGITQRDLADKMKVSPARISQILSATGKNLTLRSVGKLVHALNEDFEFVSVKDIQKLKSKDRYSKERHRNQAGCGNVLYGAWEFQETPWTDASANQNPVSDLARRAQAA